ncbi:uncharacterized protein At5g50100, chloroplastic [Nymphaea colorata]|nr:uncharacterized protein At5g50100, chloroplastic [Nymphaea colorata]XP_031481330.1 uncharacterized protein At5g50100, chloroplastic [Nymphaea colorata]
MVSRVMCLRKSGSFFLNSTPHHLNLPSPLLANVGYRHWPGAKYKISAVHSDTSSAQKVLEKEQEKPSEKWRIKMLYDGECPLCMREVNMLKEQNERFGTIKFVDISSSNYSPEENEGLDYKTVMGRIHAISYDGTVLTDVAAFRRLYEEVGLGWVYAITKYEPIASIADAIYGVWAKYRLQITGRPPLEKVLEERRKKMVDACENDACRM